MRRRETAVARAGRVCSPATAERSDSSCSKYHPSGTNNETASRSASFLAIRWGRRLSGDYPRAGPRQGLRIPCGNRPRPGNLLAEPAEEDIMAQQNSFDVSTGADLQEVDNA